MTDRCVCGRPLHYDDPHIALFYGLRPDEIRAHIEEQIALLGETMPVTIGTRTWIVPRHFIALHGIHGPLFPEMATRYGFPEVTR